MRDRLLAAVIAGLTLGLVPLRKDAVHGVTRSRFARHRIPKARAFNYLILHSFHGNLPPCSPPHGYLWARDRAGARRWRLRKAPPQEGRAIYDQQHDRYIVLSGHGYVKPRYLTPGEFELERSSVWHP